MLHFKELLIWNVSFYILKNIADINAKQEKNMVLSKYRKLSSWSIPLRITLAKILKYKLYIFSIIVFIIILQLE